MSLHSGEVGSLFNVVKIQCESAIRTNILSSRVWEVAILSASPRYGHAYVKKVWVSPHALLRRIQEGIILVLSIANSPRVIQCTSSSQMHGYHEAPARPVWDDRLIKAWGLDSLQIKTLNKRIIHLYQLFFFLLFFQRVNKWWRSARNRVLAN